MIFTPAYKMGGGPIESRSYYIPTATAIVKGQVVQFTTGTGIVVYGANDADDAVLGIAAEDHAANSGYSIEIWDDPNIIFKCVPATTVTADSGDATSFVDASILGADDVFNGGKIVITDANSIAGFNVGDVLTITDFANSGGDVTVSGAGGTIAAGLAGYIYPGKRAVLSHSFDTIGTTYNNLDMLTTGGETFVITDVEWVPTKKHAIVYFKIRLHQLANDGASIS